MGARARKAFVADTEAQIAAAHGAQIAAHVAEFGTVARAARLPRERSSMTARERYGWDLSVFACARDGDRNLLPLRTICSTVP